MNAKLIERILAAAVFVYALVLYLLTVAPTASFWDSGEFIAIAHGLQVSHPPGAPFYMLVGRLFSMVLAPVLGLFKDTGAIALSINLVSVAASALTVLLTHLSIVRLAREWQGEPEDWTTTQRVAALAGGVLGACTFAVTDSFWFNAVEAEVYALSMFFTAAVVWLILKWAEEARIEEASLPGDQHPFSLRANRYLVLIAYLFGLAIGVHLLNLLAIFFIALLFFFSEYDRPDWTAFDRWKGIALTGLVSSLGFLLVYPVIIQKLPQWAGASGVPMLFLLGVLGLVVLAVYLTQRRAMPAANLVALSVLMVLIGYSTYALIFIRSAADPPIDENDPETASAFVSYLTREQYGETPLLKGPSFDNRTGRITQDDDKLFPRRYSPQPSHWTIYRQYDSDGEFFWEYQLKHMYWRYFLWNFVGKAADTQDSPAITGIAFIDNGIERGGPPLMLSPSERAGRNAYYGLPLLLGLFGMLFHFQRDWRRAFSVLVLFFVTGVGIILYLNQTPMQPRERDYSYVASFFAFSLWIGLGGAGVVQLVGEALREKAIATAPVLVGLAAVLFAVVPGLMLLENYADHDRSGQFVPPDYAYNMLMSTAPNAILFTNGDNDTFPLWYLQEVEGVRQDVRVVNLSLLNTPWYVKQLKNQASRTSEPLPISLSDAQIDRLGIVGWQPAEVALPVDKQKLSESREVSLAPSDFDRVESPMVWTLRGRPYSQDLSILYGADVVALDILKTNAEQGWTRPVYFAVTVSPDGQLDLQDYFQLEGQAFRIVPIRHDEPLGRVVPEITPARLAEFRFTGLDDPEVYYDENIRHMVDNYRNIYSQTAEQLAQAGESAEAVALLDRLMEEMPFETIPGDERSFLFLARAYQAAGAEDRTTALLQKTEPLVLRRLERANSQRDLEYAAQVVNMVRLGYLDARAFEAASAFNDRIADVLGDDSYRTTPQELRQQYLSLYEDTAAAPLLPPADVPTPSDAQPPGTPPPGSQ